MIQMLGVEGDELVILNYQSPDERYTTSSYRRALAYAT